MEQQVQGAIQTKAPQGAPESFLTSCVPDGELYSLILQGDEFQPEVHPCKNFDIYSLVKVAQGRYHAGSESRYSPIVGEVASSNSSVVKRTRREDFPTPLSPTSKICTDKSDFGPAFANEHPSAVHGKSAAISL